jgi:thiol-disulfide isomerase/thioredoxin
LTGKKAGKSVFAVAAVLLLLGGLVVTGGAFCADGDKSASLYPEKIPNFITTDLADKGVNLKEEAGKNSVLLVNFWGIRCGACIEEMSALDVIFEKYGGSNFDILAVNVDGIESATITTQLAKIREIPKYRLIPDPDFKLVDLFRMTAAPLTVLFNGNGEAVYRHEGYAKGDEEELISVIEKVLSR